MVQIIETNISLTSNNAFIDFQSRVIEVKSWKSYVYELMEGESVSRKSSLGNMYGESLPRNVDIYHFEHDERHLSFSFYNKLGVKMKKLAYLINE